MSFDLGKKLAAGGFILVLIRIPLNAIGLAAIPTIIGVISMLSVAGGFAMMWLTGGNILHLGIGGLYAVGFIVSLLFPSAWIITGIASILYILVWAFKRFSDGDMTGAVMLGGAAVLTLASSFILDFLIRLGLALSVVSVVSLLITLAAVGIKTLMALSESEK